MRCDATYDCAVDGNLKSWHRHLYRTGHKETIRFTCEYCGAIFDREEFYQNHPCTKNKEADIEWTTYVLKESDSKLVQFLISSGRKEYEVADICLEEKFAIPHFWPPVNLPSSWFRRKETGDLYKSSCNTHGIFLLNKILSDRVTNGEPNSLILAKNIKICDKNGETLLFLPESVTRPTSDHFTTTDIDAQTFEIALTNPPKCTAKEQPLDDNKDLKVYQSYSKEQGFPFSPHRYPLDLAKTKNMFLEPYLIEEKLLENYVGLSVEKFWELSDIIHESPLSNLVRLPPACLALLFRYKIGICDFYSKGILPFGK